MKKIDSKYTWNLSALYKSDDDPQIEKDIKMGLKANAEFVKKWENNTEYLVEPKTLLAALKEYEELIVVKNGGQNFQDLYLGLKSSLDSEDTELKAKINKYNDLQTKANNNLQFFEYNISKIEKGKQSSFLKYKPLSNYKHYLEKLFSSAKYLLSEQEEKLLLITEKTSHTNWVDMVEEFLSTEQREMKVDGKKKLLNFEQILTIATSNKSVKIRDSATEHINEIQRKILPVAVKEINSILEYKRQIDEKRGLTRPDELRLVEDDINPEVVDPLITSVTKGYGISKRYYKLKAKILGKEKLKYNERMLSLGEYYKKFEYEEAKEIVLNEYKELDKEIYDIAKPFFDEGRVDVYPKKGKRGGAFCTITLVTEPSYILLNHDDELEDVRTIAHELGHGVNHELMRMNNTELNYTSSKATAEVASTFFEDMVFQKISKGLSDSERFTILVKKLEQDIGSIFRQVALYKFELELHTLAKDKGYLSDKELGELFIKHMSSYMGDGISYDKGSENWWVYWSHIRYFFYVYSYASGQLISKALQSMVRKDPKSIEVVKNFLKQGGGKSPKDIFLEMGIDITKGSFWDSGIQEVEQLLSEVEQLAKKLGKI